METNAPTTQNIPNTRWLQLIVGVICMAMIANLQYGWTLFVDPIHSKFGWDKALIQISFTLFVLAETWLVPFEGYLVDKYGPKLIVMIGAIFCGLSWVLYSYATSLPVFYFAAIVGGAGAGAVYGTCIGNALKWFPDRRGLAAGLTASGFGAGAALTILPISFLIQSSGFEKTFFIFGLIQGAIVFVLSFFLKAPYKNQMTAVSSNVVQTRKNYSPTEVLKQPVFWVLYAMFVMIAAGGLMATAQLAVIARDFHVASVPLTILGLTLPALTLALSFNNVINGLTRPFFGWVSDYIGREKTMLIAYLLEGIGILALYYYGRNPVLFVILSGLVFFAWGEIFSLFPATCTDTFGPQYATANAGMLYTAKGTAALLVPISSLLAEHGGWQLVFWVASILNIVAALTAWFILKPLRRSLINSANNQTRV
jgi:OFA family oxalate/formate antiporter-like MFS transporter